MKKALSYLLLLSYLVILVKPVLPYVADFLAHAFWKYEHIATVHQENGKTHIHFELQKAAKETGGEKNNLPSKTENEVTPHVIAIVAYDFVIVEDNQNQFSSGIYYLPSISIGANYPPPKA
ncbi:MAG: hypothetical protein V4722_18970 [Bacteroidota bacterium]